MMKFIVATILAIFVLGCDFLFPEPDVRWEIDQRLRQELFFKCLDKIPQGPERTKYNDWAEVVEACDEAAYYMSYKKKAEVRSSVK